MPCALCGQTSLSTISTVDAKSRNALNVAICGGCGLVQQDPLPSEIELRHFYAHTYRTDYKNTYTPKAKHVYRAGRAAIERVNFLRSHGVHGGKLLDVGAGGGEFVYISKSKGYDSRGIEPNLGYSEFARTQYGVEIKTGELREAGGAYDIITMFHVLEHMPNFESLRIAWSMLNEGGYLFIEVPNIETNDASPHNIYFKAHLFYFNRATLSACASKDFAPLVIEERSNLRILFKRKSRQGHISLPKQDDVSHIALRLRQKGWFEYLFAGGGIYKPFLKLTQLIQEAKVKHRSNLDILNSILS
jgi:2-polyprenyl-3-methyl-5-hydroxy-6-metoxy-1,4-benzoquinol methylase